MQIKLSNACAHAKQAAFHEFAEEAVEYSYCGAKFSAAAKGNRLVISNTLSGWKVYYFLSTHNHHFALFVTSGSAAGDARSRSPPIPPSSGPARFAASL